MDYSKLSDKVVELQEKALSKGVCAVLHNGKRYTLEFAWSRQTWECKDSNGKVLGYYTGNSIKTARKNLIFDLEN